MEVFGFYFSWIELILFALFLLVFIYQVYFYARYIYGVLRKAKKITKNKISFSSQKPPVSIIIAAKNEEENLRRFLPQIMAQDYPEFEVIVINDASCDDTEFVCDAFKKQYPNLRTSFIPDGTKNISSKKLAITLGVKAAKYDVLLFTDADCYPQDKMWIAQMVRNFNPDTEFVLGYGAYESKKGFLNSLITYDTLFIALQYMGMALVGKPYMGVGRNMAYRKETFFRLKGFSSNLDLLSGDDDLLVNQACHKGNTGVEVSLESITWSKPKETLADWHYQKMRHLSTSVRYKKTSKMQLGIEPFTRGLFYVLFILLMIFGNLITVAATGFFFLARLAVQLIIVNKSSRMYNGKKYLFTLPVLDILLPLITLSILLTGRFKKHNISWK